MNVFGGWVRKGGGVDWLVGLDEGMVGYWPKGFSRSRVCAIPY